jgi:hypothetical protein
LNDLYRIVKRCTEEPTILPTALSTAPTANCYCGSEEEGVKNGNWIGWSGRWKEVEVKREERSSANRVDLHAKRTNSSKQQAFNAMQTEISATIIIYCTLAIR